MEEKNFRKKVESLNRGDQFSRDVLTVEQWDLLYMSGQFTPFNLTGAEDQLSFTGDKQLLLSYIDKCLRQTKEIKREKKLDKSNKKWAIAASVVAVVGLLLSAIYHSDEITLFLKRIIESISQVGTNI